VKGLLAILAAGLVAFMAIAMAQEWETFASAWFGDGAAASRLDEPERKAAADAVHLVLNLLGHLYASDGDPRFADRIPAAQGIVDEALADIDYLKRNHRRQEPELLRMEVTGVEELGPERVEISTVEYWVVRTVWITGEGPSDPPRAQVVRARYLVVRGGQGWRVEGWEIDTRPPTDAEGS